MKTAIQNIRNTSGITTLMTMAVCLFAARTALADTDIWTGGGGSGNLFWLSVANWQAGTLPQAGDQLVFTNTVGLVNSNNYPAGFTFGGITFQAPAGGFALNGRSVTLTNNITDLQAYTPETVNLNLTNINSGLSLDVAPNGVLVLNGKIYGTAGLTNIGAGEVDLNGANQFLGSLTVNNGKIVIANDANLGTNNGVATPGSIVLNGGALEASADVVITNRGIALGPTSGTGFGGIATDPGTTLAYGGVMADNGGTGILAKSGYGTLALSGQNTYSGPTTNSTGTLLLDFTGASSSDIINPSSSLTLGGGNAGSGEENVAQLIMAGGSSADSQGFASTFATFGGSAILATNGSGGSVNLSLGALSHDPGGTLVFVTPEASGGGHITTTSANVNGILGGWARISGDGNGASTFSDSGHTILTGTNYAAVDISGNIVNYTGYSNVTAVAGTMASQIAGSPAPPNVSIDDSSAATTVNVDTDTAGTTSDVNAILWTCRSAGYDGISIGTNNVLRLGQYGGLLRNGPNTTVIVGGPNGAVQSGSGTHGFGDIGTLTAGGADNTPGEIDIVANNPSSTSGTIIVEPIITDNGTGPVTVVKTGPGSIKLDGHNSYSGGLYLLQGRVQFAGAEINNTNADGINGNPEAGGTGPIYVLPGAYLFPSGIGTGIITNDLYVAGGGDAHEPLGAIRSGNFSSTIHLIGDTQIGGGSYYGPIVGPFGLGLCMPATTHSDVRLYNPGNDWTGNTTMNAEDHSGTQTEHVYSETNDVIPNGFGYGNVSMEPGGGRSTSYIVWDLNGFNDTINGLSTSGTHQEDCIITNGAGAGTVSTLTMGDNDQSGIFDGKIDGGDTGAGTLNLIKIGAGVETFNNVNTYSGDTTISNGVLQLTGLASIANSANVNIDGGVFDVSQLSYAIPATQTINISGGTLFISSAGGTTPVNFTNGTLEVAALNAGGARLTAQTVNLGGAANFLQPVNIPPIASYTNDPPLSIFPIIQYTTLNGDPATMGLTLPAAYGGYASNDPATSTIYLVLTNGPITPSLTWVGFSGGALNSSWDFIASDWTNTVKHDTESYVDGALVTFDDNGRTNVVNLTDAFLPLGVTINNSVQDYTFTGVGAINGTNGVTKLGTGRLILDNSGGDSYSGGLTIGGGGTVQVGAYDTNGSVGTGPIAVNGNLIFERTNNVVLAGTISGSGAISQLGTNSLLVLNGGNSFSGTILVTNKGILQAGNNSALGTSNTVTTIASGSSLDVNGNALAGAQIVTSGIGATNSDGTTNGAIYNSSPTAAFPAVARVTLLGDTVFGCPPSVSSVLSNRWDLRSSTTSDANGAALSTGGHAYNLTKIGINQVGIVGATVDPALGNIDVQNGILSIEAATTGLGDPSKTLTIESGADLSLYQATNQFNKHIVLYGAGLANNLGTVNNTSGNNTIVGPMVLNSSPNGGVEVTFRSAAGLPAGGSLTLSNTITVGVEEPVTTLFSKEDTNTLIVAGTVNFGNGGINVNDGTFILNGINNNPASRLVENTHTLGVPTILGGNGTNKGPVTVNDVFWPGVGGTPSTFGSGAFAMGGTLNATFSLGSVTNAGGGTNDLLNVVGDFDPEFATVYTNLQSIGY